MKTKSLIDALANSETETPRKAGDTRWALAALLGLAGALAILGAFIGPRLDLGASAGVTFAKAAFSALFAAAGLALTARLARPGRPAQTRARMLGAIIVLSFAGAGIALLGADPDARMRAWTGGAFPWCLVLIPLLALPAALALGWVVRALAPTQLTLTGAAIGAASGGLGAMAYALHCPVDSIAFVATWYALAIALCAALGAIVGARLLRW